MGRRHMVSARLNTGEREALGDIMGEAGVGGFTEWLRKTIREQAPIPSTLDPRPEDELSDAELATAAELGVTPADYLAAKRKS